MKKLLTILTAIAKTVITYWLFSVRLPRKDSPKKITSPCFTSGYTKRINLFVPCHLIT